MLGPYKGVDMRVVGSPIRLCISAAVLGLAALALAPVASAAPTTTSCVANVNGGAWDEPSTWDCGEYLALVKSTVAVTIPPGITVVVPDGTTVDNEGVVDVAGTLEIEPQGVFNNHKDMYLWLGATMTNTGMLSVPEGGQLLGGGLLRNEGLALVAGQVSNQGLIQNFGADADFLVLEGATLDNYAAFENRNEASLYNDGDIDNLGDFTNIFFATTYNESTGFFYDTGVVTNTKGSTFVNDGEMQLRVEGMFHNRGGTSHFDNTGFVSLFDSARLDNSLNGEIHLAKDSLVTVLSGGIWNVSGGHIDLDGVVEMSSLGFGGSPYFENGQGSTVEVGTGAMVVGSGSTAFNAGAMMLRCDGLLQQTATFDNAGMVFVEDIDSLQGSLSGNPPIYLLFPC